MSLVNNNHHLKRCLEHETSCVGKGDRDSAFSKVDEKTSNLVLGSKLLNACKSGNTQEALSILLNITSFHSIKIVDPYNTTAYSYAKYNGMSNVVKKIDEKTYNLILGSKLLNACKSGDTQKALSILSNITSFDSVKMEDEDNKTAFFYALHYHRNVSLARSICDKEFSCLIDACNDNDLERFEYIYKRMGRCNFRKTKYTPDELALIIGTYSDILKSNWENERETDFDLSSFIGRHSCAGTSCASVISSSDVQKRLLRPQNNLLKNS